jgi:hypothetical protein
MKIAIIQSRMPRADFLRLAEKNYGSMIKGVVDLRQKIIALGGELHADAEAVLLEAGSSQEDLWGFNVYTRKPETERLEYTSFINIRPRQDNRSLEIQDPRLRERVKEIVDVLIPSHD